MDLWNASGALLPLVRNRALVPLLDRFLLDRVPHQVAQGYHQYLEVVTAAAALRTRLAPLTDDEVERFLVKARELPAQPVSPTNAFVPARVSIGGLGLYELLATAAPAGRHDLLRGAVQVAAGERVECVPVPRCGRVRRRLETGTRAPRLASIYGRPRVFEFDDRLLACKTAAKWGDESAKQALIKLKAQSERRMRNI